MALAVMDRPPSAARKGILYGLLASAIWGGYLAVTRRGIQSGLAAEDMAFLRYATAGLILLPWILKHSPQTLAGLGWPKGIVLTALAGPPFIIIGASGFHYAPLAHSAVIQLGMLTLMSNLLAAMLLGDVPNRRRILGLAIVIAGLCATVGAGPFAGGSTAWIGDILFATAGSMWALFTVLQRRWIVAPMHATAIVSVLAAAIYAPIYLASGHWRHLVPIDPALLIEQIVVQGVLAGVIALFAFGRAVQDLGASRAALFPAIAPGVAILIGIPLTGEIPTPLQGAGTAILSLGLFIAVGGIRAADGEAPRALRTRD